MKVLPKGLLMRVQQKELAALKSNNCITGRQVLHMVYDWLRTDEHMSVMYGHVDLLEIPWMGDRANDMQKLCNCWDNVLDNMQEALSDIVKRDLLYPRDDLCH